MVDASRHINLYIKKIKDSLDDLAFLIQEKDFLAVDDLDSGYWHVPLHPSQYQYFECSIFNAELGLREYYWWIVLFLGLSNTVYISSLASCCLWLSKFLRIVGWEGVIYIDDMGTLGRDFFQWFYSKFFACDIMGRAS